MVQAGKMPALPGSGPSDEGHSSAGHAARPLPRGRRGGNGCAGARALGVRASVYLRRTSKPSIARPGRRPKMGDPPKAHRCRSARPAARFRGARQPTGDASSRFSACLSIFPVIPSSAEARPTVGCGFALGLPCGVEADALADPAGVDGQGNHELRASGVIPHAPPVAMRESCCARRASNHALRASGVIHCDSHMAACEPHGTRRARQGLRLAPGA